MRWRSVPARKFRGVRLKVVALWRRKWFRVTAGVLAVPTVLLCVAFGYYYVVFARMIDARLHGERQRTLPRVFARPLELRRGQSLSERQLVDRLNDLGYTLRQQAEKPGEFTVANYAVSIVPRGEEFRGRTARVLFQKPAPVRTKTPPKTPPKNPDRIEKLEIATKASERLTLDAPLLTSMVAEREKRRPVALSAIP